MSPVKGQPCERAVTSVEIDVLDMVGRPPTTDKERIQAYWQYLDCPTQGCNGWLWRRHTTDAEWGIRCYKCGKSWRDTYPEHGWKLWDPKNKSRYVP